MRKLIQYVLTIGSGIILFFLNRISEEYAGFVCVGLVLILGIPHGALDHKIHQTTNKRSRIYKYVITYLLIAGGYVIWWLIDPIKALFAFILLSAYHFGQEMLEEHNLKSFGPFSCIIWGVVVLVMPMILEFHEVKPFIRILTSMELPIPSMSVKFIISGVLLLTALFNLIYHSRKSAIEIGDAIKLIVFIVSIVFIHLLLDYLIAFTLYFVFFHSLNAFKHQYRWLSGKQSGYTIRRFITDLVSFGVIAIVGIVLLLWLINPADQSALITFFFILISLITLPHTITLDQFYRSK